MTLHVAQAVFPFFTNLPTDVIVNRFHFDVLNISSAAAADEIATRLFDFYNDVYGATQVSRANYIDWPQAVVKVFNLDDPTPRIPEVRNLGFNAGTGVSDIPTEVAAVLSFHAAPESGVRFQRLYNRIYVGAIMPTQMQASAVDAFPTFASSLINNSRSAMQNLLAANDLDVFWRQVSDATGAPVARPIVGGWVDNSPDTQRRRSVLSTSRNNWAPL